MGMLPTFETPREGLVKIIFSQPLTNRPGGLQIFIFPEPQELPEGQQTHPHAYTPDPEHDTQLLQDLMKYFDQSRRVLLAAIADGYVLMANTGNIGTHKVTELQRGVVEVCSKYRSTSH